MGNDNVNLTRKGREMTLAGVSNARRLPAAATRALAFRATTVAGLMAMALVVISAQAAQAATSTVTCSVPALVAAIDTANSSPGADTLSLAAGCTYALTSPDNGANGLPVITSDITIEGHGAI